MEIDYGSYLKVDELLDLQELQSDGEHDELLFIVVHQVYELWFKQLLHELDRAAELIDADEVARAGVQLIRVLKILKTIVQQVDVLETMTPLHFESFRSFLGASSGFQSVQFRELEFVLGHKQETHLERFPQLRRRFDEPSIWHRFLSLLARRGHAVDPGPAAAPTTPNEAAQAVLVAAYRSETTGGADADLAAFCERLVDIDEGFQEWRYRHVMMVQRTIGTKPGTGGSPGAAYLRTTLFSPFFPDLWAIRTRF